MRVHDSLEEGISFFMAELKRLKEVVDQAESRDAQHDRILLFLLDEILQGTNSHERQIAVRRVVQRLLQAGAMGAVSTHDLDLAASEELSAACDAVNFRESFAPDGQMTFDYEMRPGITGFWQISERNETSFAERAGFDTAYFRQVSLVTDMKVLAETVKVVFRGTGY